MQIFVPQDITFFHFLFQPSIQYNGSNAKADKKANCLDPLPIKPDNLETSPGVRRRQKKFGMSDFKFIKVLGKGSFGKVSKKMYVIYLWASSLRMQFQKQVALVEVLFQVNQ